MKLSVLSISLASQSKEAFYEIHRLCKYINKFMFTSPFIKGEHLLTNFLFDLCLKCCL